MSSINPRRRQLRLYWELLLELAKRETRRRYKDTALGWIWIILLPLIQSAVIAFLFVKLAGVSFSDPKIPYVLIVLSGFTVWNFVSHAVSQAMTALSDSMELINTQPLPLTLLPLAGALVKTYDWLIELLVFVILTVILTGSIPTTFFMGILPLAVSLTMFVAGLALLTSLLGSFVRDSGHLISLFLSVWFWLSPIFYTASRIPTHLRAINLNPLVHFLAAFRQISLEGVLDAEKLAKLFIMSAIVFVASLIIFHRTSRRVYDRP